MSVSSSKLQYEFAVELAAYAVEEFAKSIAVDIVLHVAVIRVIEYVENPKPHACMLLFRQADFAPDLQIGRNEAWQLQFISRANKIAVLIDG